MSARGHEFFDHTADVGIRAWGPTLADAFGAAAEGLVAYMVDVSAAKEVGEARVVVEAGSPERLLVRFLDEVLDLLQSGLTVVTRAEVRIEGGRLEARLLGEAWDAARHGHVHEVKAITFHGLEVRAQPPEVRVIVDI